jgi:nitrite reductase (NO-forming)
MPEPGPAGYTSSGEHGRVGRVTGRGAARARRHLAAGAVVLAYLAAGGVVAGLGERATGGRWLALHLVLLGAVSNAIVVWSEHFAAALLHARPASELAAGGRLLLLNLGLVAVLIGVPAGRTGLAAAGTGLVAGVVGAHAVVLARWLRGALAARLGVTVWFYLAAAAALLAGVGLGLGLAGGAAGSADGYRAARLAHAHLNLLGWVGLTVLGTSFTLWPTVLRTRMVAGLDRAARAALLGCVAGLAGATAGFLAGRRALAAAGLATYAAGLVAALVPFTGTLLRRRPHTAASWMLAAGIGWFTASVAADLAALLAADRLVDLDVRAGRLLVGVVLGFTTQVVAGALTYLLPTVLGGGPHGNRRLSRLLELAWPVRVAAWNLGVALLAAGVGAPAGRWLVGLGAGSFVLLAAAALVWRATTGPPD